MAKFITVNLIYSTSEQAFHIKPTKAEYSKLKFTSCKTSVGQLFNSIGEGKPFTCQVYVSDRRHTNNFIAQTIFALDFDETLTVKAVNQICKDYGLSFLFGYYTYRHTEERPRFRLVFACDGEIRCSKLATDLYKAFELIFNYKTDKACKDLARAWAGTNKKMFRGDFESTISPGRVFEIANELKYSKSGNRSRKFFNIDNIEKTGDSGITIQYRYKSTSIPPISVEAAKSRPLIDNWVIDDLLECKLFRVFYEGGGTPELGNKLVDRELMCMASNLMTLLGGEKLYKECLAKNPNYSDEKKSKISWLRNQKHYSTYLINNYSPFECDQQNQNKTFPELLKKKGKVEFTPDFKLELKSLKEAESELKQKFTQILSEPGNKVYLVKVAPGLGKTRFWINQKGVVIGFPSNSLKVEQFETSELPDTYKVMTPELLSKFSTPLKTFLTALYQKGMGEVASLNIKALANGKSIEGIDVNDIDRELASNYVECNQNLQSIEADKTIFTTHSRMVYQSFKQAIYVFDENAWGTLLQQQKTTIKELDAVIKHLNFRGVDTGRLEEILTLKDTDVHCTPNFANYQHIIKEIVRGNKFDSNVTEFFQSISFIIDGGFIHYQVNHIYRLPTDKKIIFLDGTASETMYRNIFGDRLEVMDITNVELRGKIEQDTSRSCSKTGLEKYHSKIAEKVGNLPVITLNGFKQYFQNPVDTLHFGNATGSNTLTGKDCCVVGTMTYHPTFYKFLASTLMLDCKNFNMENIRVTYNGRRFWFTTFDNPEMQRLHLEQVEGELLQCVHRARLIRTDATVWLYSNFPLLQAKYKI